MVLRLCQFVFLCCAFVGRYFFGGLSGSFFLFREACCDA